MKLRGDIRLTRRERDDLRSPSRNISPRWLQPLWEVAITEAHRSIEEGILQDFLQSQGLADDIGDSIYNHKILSGQKAEDRLRRLREMTPTVVAIDLETLPAVDVAINDAV